MPSWQNERLRMKQHIINFIFDVIIGSILILNLMNFNGEILHNLTAALPIFLSWCILVNFTAMFTPYLYVYMDESKKQEFKKLLQKYKSNHGKIYKIYHVLTDLIFMLLFVLNGFLGCLILFALMNFLKECAKENLTKLQREVANDE